MKIQNIVIVLLAAGLVAVSYKWATVASDNTAAADKENAEGATGASTRTDGAPSGEFREFDVTQSWDENPFTWFKGSGLLLAVGDRDNNNAMTIGWGSLGNIWRQIGNSTVTVYVAEGRYTYGFMEKYDYFTVMAFDDDHKDVLQYMGTHSGRDGDKAAALGLHTLYTENGTPYYAEASMVLECKTIYRAPFEREGMCAEVGEFYDGFDAGVHHLYIGNVVKALKK